MKNTFQKTLMIIVLTVVSFVGFGQADKASAAETWRGSSTFHYDANKTGALYDYWFKVGVTDDTSVVNMSIESWSNDWPYCICAPIYYDAFLMRWNGKTWVKDRWINGNLITSEYKWRQFTNVPKTGTPTLIWVDFYINGNEYLGSTSTPSWTR